MTPPGLTGYDFIVLDCDGVIFDSNTAKVSAFYETAVEFGTDPATATAMSRWQTSNFGTSRYVIFERLVSGTFGPVPTSLRADHLLDSYATKARGIYDSVSVTQGLVPFLDAHEHERMYVASGSDEAELAIALTRRGLSAYFHGVFGSPQLKQSILQNISRAESIGAKKANGVMIGDARADHDAAVSAGLEFILVARYSAVRQEMELLARSRGFRVVETLAELV